MPVRLRRNTIQPLVTEALWRGSPAKEGIYCMGYCTYPNDTSLQFSFSCGMLSKPSAEKLRSLCQLNTEQGLEIGTVFRVENGLVASHPLSEKNNLRQEVAKFVGRI